MKPTRTLEARGGDTKRGLKENLLLGIAVLLWSIFGVESPEPSTSVASISRSFGVPA